jgi:hypothetical protein
MLENKQCEEKKKHFKENIRISDECVLSLAENIRKLRWKRKAV